MSKQLQPHEQRVVDEFNELVERFDKLNAFLKKGQPSFIDDENWGLLNEQYDAMSWYRIVLTNRIKLFGGVIEMSDEQQIEQQIQSKNLNAPRLTPADIDSVIISETYTNLPDGRTTVCQLTLRNGFTVTGESACVSIENFNQEIGNEIARTNAREKIWQLEGYLLKEKLYQKSLE